MGSPLTFWKLQQAPTLWALDRLGLGDLGRRPDRPPGRAPADRPARRALDLAGRAAGRPPTGPGGSTARGRWRWPSASSPSSPNLLAHGALVTMELPLVACTSAMFFVLLVVPADRAAAGTSGRPAALGGLALSCKFTTVLIPPILGLVWGIDLWLGAARRAGRRRALADRPAVGPGMVGFVAGDGRRRTWSSPGSRRSR